jgi:hypothetical protein
VEHIEIAGNIKRITEAGGAGPGADPRSPPKVVHQSWTGPTRLNPCADNARNRPLSLQEIGCPTSPS